MPRTRKRPPEACIAGPAIFAYAANASEFLIERYVATQYFFQIPLERDWPGEPFLLFLLVVIAATLCFGTRVGLVSVAVSAFLSGYFFEPVGAPAVTVRFRSRQDRALRDPCAGLRCRLDVYRERPR
jgi:hypothetical protein